MNVSIATVLLWHEHVASKLVLIKLYSQAYLVLKKVLNSERIGSLAAPARLLISTLRWTKSGE